ncbi:hypothetical protein Tco_1338513 [Tanacetum coccineum]
MIDLHNLAKLNIYGRFGDTWAWVAPGPERQPDAAVDALEAAEDVLDAAEGAQDVPAPEEMREIQGALNRQHKVMDTMARDLSKFTAWAPDGISHLLDVAGASYTRYSKTRIPYQRHRVRQTTRETSTSAAPDADD